MPYDEGAAHCTFIWCFNVFGQQMTEASFQTNFVLKFKFIVWYLYLKIKSVLIGLD
jgi:hypothetical protein